MPRATLKVLGLCAALLVLVAAVTVAVAVMVWRSEAVGKLRGCQERAANESRELGNAVAELERERARLQQAQDALRRELAQAHGDSKKLNGSLVSCRERAVGAGGDGDRRVLGHLHAWGERWWSGEGGSGLKSRVMLHPLGGISPRSMERAGTDGKDAVSWKDEPEKRRFSPGMQDQQHPRVCGHIRAWGTPKGEPWRVPVPQHSPSAAMPLPMSLCLCLVWGSYSELRPRCSMHV